MNSPVTTRTLMLVSVAAVTAVTLLSGCAPLVIGGAATAVMMAEDRRSSGVFVDDENIENRALLKVKTRYNNQVHVNITSYNRHVLISGEAASEAVKKGVEEEVATVAGIKRIFNEMAVGPQAGVMAVSNDTRLTTIVKTRFLEANRFQPNHVKVVTEAGVVYLMGIVKRSEADAAAQLASTTAGVSRVVRLFEYLD
ncbi:MAG TPA: BON domain-containing protein [Casimicrobium huifangae]|uniref:BON domain-containing protein n=1 Tax=Casimicrobium huifangae TaxID=2591109 RepID=UPI001EE35587|nr:BON domain-containing protein [Casimicrobium huifangae]HOB00376.1 BON domain-containing protein [Casimicrobium huifangae]HQD64162.1 BON domain-containing protein [Casimicrobium huifangae]